MTGEERTQPASMPGEVPTAGVVTYPFDPTVDERPDPSIPPISYCRVFQVGPICPKLCGDCAATYRRKREWNRAGNDGRSDG